MSLKNQYHHSSRGNKADTQTPMLCGGMCPPRVIVIGAGMAGVVVVRELLSKGWKPHQLLLLEASDQVGGRAQTRNHPHGFIYDEGAAWIHGTDGNPLVALANQLGIELKEIAPRNPWYPHYIRHPYLYFDLQRQVMFGFGKVIIENLQAS